jgi:hypothetical protein
LPTETPEIRTSDSTASWVASSKGTLTRYPLEPRGTGPPNAIQRKSSRPKHESAKATAMKICPRVGAFFCMAYSSPSRNGSADGGQICSVVGVSVMS